MVENGQSSDARGATPPYIAFQSIKTLAKDLKEHGLPGRIDRSVLTNFSGAVASQIMTALKFLQLTLADGTPTQNMRDLVESFGTLNWPKMVATVVRSSYPALADLNLQTASPSQFTETFRKAYPGKDEVLRKCMTFYLNAVREAEISISPYILKNKKPRSAPTKRRSKADGDTASTKRERRQNIDDGEDDGDNGEDQRSPVKTPYEVLMSDIYNPTEMEPDSPEEKAVFTLARFLKKKESE